MLAQKKSLTKILGTFTKTINDLELLIQQNSDIEAANDVKIRDLKNANSSLEGERNEAQAVLKNIKTLIGTSN